MCYARRDGKELWLPRPHLPLRLPCRQTSSHGPEGLGSDSFPLLSRYDTFLEVLKLHLSGLVELKQQEKKEKEEQKAGEVEGAGAHLKCPDTGIHRVARQAPAVATSSFRRKFYFTQIRVNLPLASRKKCCPRSKGSDAVRRQGAATVAATATAADLSLPAIVFHIYVSV